MAKISKSLEGWGDASLFTAIITSVIGFVAWIFGESPATLLTGICLFPLRSLFKGFAALVQNAEEQLDERFQEKLNEE